MAFLPISLAPRDAVLTDTSARSKVRSKRSLMRRLFDAMVHARQIQAEREIARYLELTGGKLTDGIEREIERRFISGN